MGGGGDDRRRLRTALWSGSLALGEGAEIECACAAAARTASASNSRMKPGRLRFRDSRSVVLRGRHSAQASRMYDFDRQAGEAQVAAHVQAGPDDGGRPATAAAPKRRHPLIWRPIHTNTQRGGRWRTLRAWGAERKPGHLSAGRRTYLDLGEAGQHFRNRRLDLRAIDGSSSTAGDLKLPA